MANLHTYTRVNFKDKPNQTTPMNKTNWDHVEDGISNAYVDIATLNTEKAANEPTFSTAVTRTNISSGESMPTILGKIKKFFADLKTVAFSGNYNDLSNKPSVENYVVDVASGLVSMNRNSTYSGTLSATKAGYTAVGIVGAALGNASSSDIPDKLFIPWFTIGSSTITYKIRHLDSSGSTTAFSVNPIFLVLYKKN